MGLIEELVVDCGFDYRNTLERFMGQDKLINQFMKLFVETEEKEMEKFASNIEVQEVSLIRQSAHSLKGAARNMGLDNIGNLCSALQWVCDGKPDSYVDRATSELLIANLMADESQDEIMVLYNEILFEYKKAEQLINKYLG